MIYLDNAATTKVRQEVINMMNECNEFYGNPSTNNAMGKKSRDLIENARNIIANSISAKPNEIIFTSGATEANNLAIQGVIRNRRSHIITTAVEHVSVLNPIWHLCDMGCDVTVLSVDNNGLIDLQELKNSIRRNTILVSIIMGNNEIGTIQPIKEIGEMCKQYGICFHTDAVSAFGHCDIDVNELNINMMSISAHKIYAPKGVGFLYIKNNIEISPLFYGSNQEFGLRSGTENVNGIVGMGKAVELLSTIDNEHLKALKNKLTDGIRETIPGVKFNGLIEHSLPNIVNISFKDVNSKDLITALSENEIYISTGSPYFTRPPHVLTAIGLSNDLAYSTVRFSFGIYNIENDVDCILDILPNLIEQLREENNSVKQRIDL